MAKLDFEPDSLTNFVARADANFQFTTPLKIQVLSSSNRVITGGPNSMLVIIVANYFIILYLSYVLVLTCFKLITLYKQTVGNLVRMQLGQLYTPACLFFSRM